MTEAKVIVDGVMAHVAPCLESLIGKVNAYYPQIRAAQEAIVELEKRLEALERENKRLKEDMYVLMEDAICNRRQPVNSPWK